MNNIKNKFYEVLSMSIPITLIYNLFGMANTLIPLTVKELGYNDVILGLLLTTASFFSLIFAIPAGIITQKYNVKLPIGFTCFIQAVCCIIFFLFNKIQVLLFCLILYKICEMIIQVGIQVYIASLSDETKLDFNFSLYGITSALGLFIGSSLVGFIINFYGNRNTFLIIGFLAIINAIFSLIFIYTVNRSINMQKRYEWSFARIKDLINYPIVIIIIITFVLTLSNGAHINFFPVFLKKLEFKPYIIGIIISLKALSLILSRLLMMPILKLLGNRYKTIIVFIFIFGLSNALIPQFCRDLISLSIFSMLIGFCTGIAFPLSMSALAANVNKNDLGIAMGVRITGGRIAEFINPIFFGTISQFYGIQNAFLSIGLILLFSNVLLISWIKKNIKKNNNN